MPPFRRVLAIADDLSGAAETAAGLRSRTTRSRVLLLGPAATGPEEISAADARAVTVLDLDSRHCPAEDAADAVRGALRMAPTGDTLVLKKIDSLLRGNVAAEVAALAADGPGVVVAPALPVAGRVVRAGVVHLGGVPLHEGEAWRAEATAPPSSVADALGGLPTALIPLATVRAARPTLLSALRAAVAAGRVAVCDAETDADLDAIVTASLADVLRLRLVGTGGLATALGRHLAAEGAAHPAPAAGPEAAEPTTRGRTAPRAEAVETADRPVLVVIGTAEPGAVEQVRRLVADGAVHVPLDLAGLLSEPPAAALPPLTAPVTVVTIAPPAGPPRGVTSPATTAAPEAVGTASAVAATARHHTATTTAPDGTTNAPAPPRPETGSGDGAAPGPVPARRLVHGLARAVAAALAAHDGGADLVLTGGETARRVLDALAITRLDPVGQVHHGAVHLRTPDGRSVVTRPGSFGDPDSLRHIVRALHPHSTERKVTS
ncbi:four-carbon acid sugar kinase family protein [Streptomyces sp. NEAU-S77]|uniref:four-carbon acid sugar kinase family protein n=1 Tax=Streptomyces sp. NEAU-S77 TaxID=3411033 RepID=UPI003BA2BF1B